MSAGADSSITFNATLIPNIGPESKLIGASFNKENLNKVSSPIIGKTGVYLVKVNGMGEKIESPEKAIDTRNQTITNLRNQSGTGWFDDIKKRASVKDNRSKFY